MLDIAIKYKDQLNSKIKNIYFNDKYKYWFADNIIGVNMVVYDSKYRIFSEQRVAVSPV